MNAPVRIQLSRRKGWKMPANTVIVARRVKAPNWGNPFNWQDAMDEYGCTETEAKQWAKDTYLELAMLALSDRPDRDSNIVGHEDAKLFIRENIGALAGKNLACWCKPGEPCHADVLITIANHPRCDEVKP